MTSERGHTPRAQGRGLCPRAPCGSSFLGSGLLWARTVSSGFCPHWCLNKPFLLTLGFTIQRYTNATEHEAGVAGSERDRGCQSQCVHAGPARSAQVGSPGRAHAVWCSIFTNPEAVERLSRREQFSAFWCLMCVSRHTFIAHFQILFPGL